MHTANHEFVMKPKKSAGCHQTLSSQVGSGYDTRPGKNTILHTDSNGLSLMVMLDCTLHTLLPYSVAIRMCMGGKR